MAVLHLSQDAERDLDDIFDDLERRGTATAARFASAFRRKGESLAGFPESGRVRPDLGEGVRSTLVSPYVILYRFEGDVVEILRVVHGSRDLGKLRGLEGEE